MAICDRIAVMSAGRLVATFERGDWTQEAMLAAAFSGYARRSDAAERSAGAMTRASSPIARR